MNLELLIGRIKKYITQWLSIAMLSKHVDAVWSLEEVKNKICDTEKEYQEVVELIKSLSQRKKELTEQKDNLNAELEIKKNQAMQEFEALLDQKSIPSKKVELEKDSTYEWVPDFWIPSFNDRIRKYDGNKVKSKMNEEKKNSKLQEFCQV